MKKFVLYTTLLVLLLGLTIHLLFSLVDGYADPYYLKISSPQKTNLILGTSKAAQGIQPQYLEKTLHKEFYNYSFSIGVSPYGSTYLNSIIKKLDTVNKKAHFILAVDAWSISSITQNPNDTSQFRETRSFLNKLISVNQRPNYKYLTHHFENKYYTIVAHNSPMLLHNDGWLEVFIHKDNTNIARRTKYTMDSYKDLAAKYQFSAVRLRYLLKTMEYLQQYGQVYLVRLPVDPLLFEIESNVLPDFNAVLAPAIQASNGYLDLTQYNNDYQYTDGVHLNVQSGQKVSATIAKWMSAHQK